MDPITPSTTPQSPLGSPFGAASTADEVLASHDLRGRHAVVTGGASGLGLETVRALVRRGAQVTVGARDVDAGRAACADLPGVAVRALDLAVPEAVDAFAAAVATSGRPLDILVNGAGIMATPLMRDARGHEAQFATNHLGHFRLALALWPALRRAEGARVVALSSRAHQRAAVDFDDVDFLRRPYDKWIAYAQSKTANALFAVALDSVGRADGIRAFAVHPGTVLGALARHLSEDEVAAFKVRDADGRAIVAPERDLKTPQQGAATALWCATSPLLAGRGGVYCEDCDIAPPSAPGRTSVPGVAPWAVDPQAAERLWRLSESLLPA